MAIDAIFKHPTFSQILVINPEPNTVWADAVVSIAFPDPALLELGKVGDRDRAAVLCVQQLKVLGAIDAATNYLKTAYEFAHANENFKHEFKIVR